MYRRIFFFLHFSVFCTSWMCLSVYAQLVELAVKFLSNPVTTALELYMWLTVKHVVHLLIPWSLLPLKMLG